MDKAILYVRVSTDEQAEKGYSQRNQEEVLRRYCDIKSIQVNGVYYEDFSAKTFNRPVWTKLLSDLRKDKGMANLILFTKWDRFSRNTGDAYFMINQLNRSGVEPQAIEQPLDLTIPENKMMLAFYLAVPEVENDRRSLNVFHGMRRAKKEGRWMATAPYGYVNKINEQGKKYIAPYEPNATAIKKAFEELAKGRYTIMQVYEMAKEKGLKCSYKNFWRHIRNPFYYGKVLIPKYKDEDEHLVDGLHEPLISEATFYEAQDFLDGKKKMKGTKIVSLEMLPLRGFLHCPLCNRKLTGSASKGSRSYFYYYHCTAGCKCRFRADLANEFFEKDIATISIKESYQDFYFESISKAYRLSVNNGDDSQRSIIGQIKVLNEKIDRARELLISGEFTGADFQAIKSKCEKDITSLESKLPDIAQNSRLVENHLNRGLLNAKDLIIKYKAGDIAMKRRIISSIHPENLRFDGAQHRTNRLNEFVGCTLLINSRLGEKKNWTSTDLLDLSSRVTPERFELSTQ
ncbi:recombinase family protein [Mucilaginibacter sp. CAU 1740]|uniref:recombinase family protein n=1 Tax=Mucilaginibacter sp. CAU 1740 TaxID=3140365 RepID=UPI00325B08A4